jgi:hypothetical protein
MTSHIAKRVTDSQPAIVLATALAAICLNHRWPAVVAVFTVLQLGIILATLGTRHRHDRPSASMRFLSRAHATPLASPVQAPRPLTRRPHLHLVP